MRYDLFWTYDSFYAAHADEAAEIGWVPPDSRPLPIGCSPDLVDFDAVPLLSCANSTEPSGQPGDTGLDRPTPMSQDDPIPRLMDTSQAAAYLGVKVRFIRRCIADGRLVVTKVGSKNRYTAADLDKLTRRQTAGHGGAIAPKRRTTSDPAPPASYDPIADAVARARLSLPSSK